MPDLRPVSPLVARVMRAGKVVVIIVMVLFVGQFFMESWPTWFRWACLVSGLLIVAAHPFEALFLYRARLAVSPTPTRDRWLILAFGLFHGLSLPRPAGRP